MLGRIHVSIPAKTTQLFSSKPHPGFVRITLLHFCISITNKLTTFFPASVSQLRASVTTKTTRKSLQLQHVPEIETENHQKVRLSVSLSFGFFWAPEFQFSIRNFESFNWSRLWKRFHLWYEPVNRILKIKFHSDDMRCDFAPMQGIAGFALARARSNESVQSGEFFLRLGCVVGSGSLHFAVHVCRWSPCQLGKGSSRNSPNEEFCRWTWTSCTRGNCW